MDNIKCNVFMNMTAHWIYAYQTNHIEHETIHNDYSLWSNHQILCHITNTIQSHNDMSYDYNLYKSTNPIYSSLPYVCHMKLIRG